MKVKANQRFILTQVNDKVWQVRSIKIENHGGKDVEVSSADYAVNDGKCSCPGYVFRKTCKHVRMVAKAVSPDDVAVDSKRANRIVKKITKALEPFMKIFGVDEFVKDADGDITMIIMSGTAKLAKKSSTTKVLSGTVDEVPVEVTLK